MDHKKCTKKKWQIPSKGALQYKLFNRRLIFLSREPAVLANQPEELVILANQCRDGTQIY
jgi:hypothetical protein